MSRAGASRKLLYVDDDDECRRDIETAFEGWAVTTATSGATAVETFENDTEFHCVVSAGSLPDTDPLSVYRSVAEVDDSVPFVLFTEPISATRIRDAFRAGVADVVCKQPADCDTEPSGQPSGEQLAGTQPTEEGGGSSAEEAATTASATQIVDQQPTDGVAGLRHRVDDLVVYHGSDLQETTFNVSRSLMSAADDEVAVKVEWALQSLATELGASQCVLYMTDEEAAQLTKTYGWQDEEIADPHLDDPVMSSIGDDQIPNSAFPGFEACLQQFESVCYDATASSEGEPDFTEEQGTLLALPIIIEWQLTGTIVITTPIPRRWTESVREQLTSVGELIIHTVQRRNRRAELEQQNERLEQFASVISHDLQNPLSVVSGYLELAMDTGDTDRLEPAVDAAERMETMLDEMLTLARAGQAIGETEPVEPAKIVDDAWIGVDAPSATLTAEGLEALPTVEADPTRLTEAFENLFRNAIDHVGEDVSITVSATADGNGIAVADDGPGIPEAKREKVFEHGYTGGNGTGLGLAIIERIIEGHGWSIHLTESESGGAKFVIEFEA